MITWIWKSCVYVMKPLSINRTKLILESCPPTLGTLNFGIVGSSHISMEFGISWTIGCHVNFGSTQKCPIIKKWQSTFVK